MIIKRFMATMIRRDLTKRVTLQSDSGDPGKHLVIGAVAGAKVPRRAQILMTISLIAALAPCLLVSNVV